MTIEQTVIKHYAKRDMAEVIREKVRARIGDEPVTLEDLAPFDDMHIGGRKASAYLLEKMNVTSDMQLLDIGCGIGGTARFFSKKSGAHVSGIDLTPEYKDVAYDLSELVDMKDRVDFFTGSATRMAFDDHHFDAAYMIHAGMNIEDKKSVFFEAARVLKPHSIFAVYDIMGVQEEADYKFPQPWADDRISSFLQPAEIYKKLMQEAGFEIIYEESRKDFSEEVLAKRLETPEKLEPDFLPRVENLLYNLQADYCSPYILIGKLQEAVC